MVKALKNIDLSLKNKYEIDKDLILYKFSNLDNSNRKISYDTSKKFIQFHFSQNKKRCTKQNLPA